MAHDCPPNFILYIVYNTAKITLQLNTWLLKTATQFYMKGLYLKKLNGEVKERYRLKSKVCKCGEHTGDISRAWGNTRISISQLKTLWVFMKRKKHKSWLDKECWNIFRSKEAG